MSCSCNCCCSHEHEKEHKSSFLKTYGTLILTAVLLIVAMILDSLHLVWEENSIIRFVIYFIAYLPVALPVAKEAWEELMEGEVFNEFTLMLLASIGAFYIGEYPEGVAVMLFYSFGELLQDKAVHRARKNIKKLLDVRPKETTRCTEEGEKIIHPDDAQVGDVLLVKPGERVPLDGKLLEQDASFDTSALTGESIPRTIHANEEVLAGMIVQEHLIRIKVSKPYNESALAHILKLVEEASAHKAPAELFIRKFAKVYTPVVTCLAFLIILFPYLYTFYDPNFHFVFNDWLYKALIFLVLSCPCALVVSIPLGYFGGIGTASRWGVLFKGSNYLDKITHLNTIVFDKTGTLTKGNFEVQECRNEQLPLSTFISLMASAEQHHSHPIAKAILAYAQEENVPLHPCQQTKVWNGMGIEATINEHQIFVGNIHLLEELNITYPSYLNDIRDTVAIGVCDGAYIGFLRLADTIKEDSAEAVASLKREHIQNITVLSGDKQSIVSQLVEKLGINKGVGDLMPDEKVAYIHEMKEQEGCQLAFVGDGINDAPALALSDIGIAMGALGSDAAIEAADVVIQTDQPSKVSTAIRIGKATRSIVWQNIIFALGVKILILLLGVLGMASLWAAVFADVGVALIAIINAVRLQFTFKE